MNVRIYPDDIYPCIEYLQWDTQETSNSHYLWEKELRTWGSEIYFSL